MKRQEYYRHPPITRGAAYTSYPEFARSTLRMPIISFPEFCGFRLLVRKAEKPE